MNEDPTTWLWRKFVETGDETYSVGWNQSDARDFNPENPYGEDTE